MNNKKLRENLTNLFKSRGELIKNKKSSPESEKTKNLPATANNKINKKQSTKYNDVNKKTPKNTQNENLEPKFVSYKKSKKNEMKTKQPNKDDASFGKQKGPVKKKVKRESENIKKSTKTKNIQNPKQKNIKPEEVQMKKAKNNKKTKLKENKQKGPLAQPHQPKFKQKTPLKPQNGANAKDRVQAKKRKAVQVKGPRVKKVKTADDMHLMEFEGSSSGSTSTTKDDSDGESSTDYDFCVESDFDDENAENYSDDSDDSDEDFEGEMYEDDSFGSSDDYTDYSEDEDEEEYDFQDEAEDDPDYELPEDEPEDLVVHKGLAVKYNLEAHHSVEFDESIESAQIVELPEQMPVGTVKQLPNYDLEQLLDLERKFIEKLSRTGDENEEDDCPKLVPIGECEDESDDGFKLWTGGVGMDSEMFSDYEEVEDSDESSTLSYSDVNRKYLQPNGADDESSDYEEGEEEGEARVSMRADIIDARTNKDEIVAGNWSESYTETSVEGFNLLSEMLEESFDGHKNEDAEVFKAIVLENFDNDSSEGEIEKTDSVEAIPTIHQNGAATPPKVYEMPAESSSEMDVDSIEESQNDSNEMENSAVDDPVNASMERSFFFNHKGHIDANFYNSTDSHHALVLLKSSFYLYGTLQATLIAGSIEVYGYKPKLGETLTLHSPRGCSAVQIRPIFDSAAIRSEETVNSIKQQLNECKTKAEFSKRHVMALLKDYDPKSSVVLLLRRNEDAEKLKQMFQRHISENIYPVHIPRSRTLHYSETMLDCMLNPTAEYALQIPPHWMELRLQADSKIMLIGGKSVGKSTLVRYLLNRHLEMFPRILLIDLDIGQPEVFVPQTVSCALLEQPLLGPGFFWQHQPDKAYAVGHTNLVLCAHAYMRAVMDLLEFCHTEAKYRNVPWLINTMGYNRGFGAELMSVICAHLGPTDIVQLQSNKPINNFEYIFEPSIVANMPRVVYNTEEYETRIGSYTPNHRLILMPSAVQQESRYQREWQMSAKDMRYIMLLARLSTVLPNEGEWLNRSEAFCCSLDNLKIVNLISKDAKEMETLRALESNLVYLCHVPTIVDTSSSNYTIQCLGIGIVNGVDYTLKKAYIIPAMAPEYLSTVNCLALGEMPLPASLLTVQDPDSESKIPYVQVMNDKPTSRAVKHFFYRT